MIIMEDGRVSRAMALVDEVTQRGLEISLVPTYLIANQSATGDLTPMFEMGIEDIIPLENCLDLLVVKMRKLRTRIEAEINSQSKITDGTATSGSLTDMNLIDLLQALGPSQKTARLTIYSSDTNLTLFLNRGRIVFAKTEQRTGAEAVYEALAWTEGKWVIKPVEQSDLPEPNNDQSNESILMEGCRLLDESARIPSA